jgi:outer membrane protein TolC
MKICKNLINLLVLLILPIPIFGQDSTMQTFKLTLQEAIELGLRASTDIQNQQLNIQLAENTARKTRSEWLPSVEGLTNLRYNTQLQTIVFPEGFGGSNTPVVIQLGTKVYNQASIEAKQTIYDAKLSQEAKITQKTVGLEKEALAQKKVETKLAISEAYYEVLLRQEENRLASQAVERAKKYLSVAEAKLDLGTMEEDELSKLRLDVQNADIKRQRAQKNRELSLQKLAKTLMVPLTSSIELTEKIEPPSAEEDLPQDVSLLTHNRPELKQAVLNNELTGLRFKKAVVGILPTLMAYANYTTLFQKNDFNLLARNAWTPFNYIGLQLNVPLFMRHVVRFEKQEYRLRQQIGMNTLARQQKDIIYELQVAKTALFNARLNYQYAQENYVLAGKVYQTNLTKYEVGRMLYSELLDVEKSLAEAEDNLLNHIYELLLARVRWQKAYGE